MNKENTIKEKAFLIFGLLIILLLSALIFKDQQAQKAALFSGANSNSNLAGNISTPLSPARPNTVSPDKFKTEVPANTVVPTASGDTLTIEQKKDTAVPTISAPSAPGSVNSTLSFSIKAEGGKFAPSKIIGRSGDTIIINFTAVDNDYSLVFPSYNMRQTAKKGETKTLGFHTSESGSFIYYCDICGANTAATGTIIVMK